MGKPTSQRQRPTSAAERKTTKKAAKKKAAEEEAKKKAAEEEAKKKKPIHLGQEHKLGVDTRLPWSSEGGEEE